MIVVFTGDGKGKTTAALGQAVRALGRGKRVLMIQFIKGPWESGEDYFFAGFRIPRPRRRFGEQMKSRFRMRKMGLGFVGILGDKLPRKKHARAAKEALGRFRRELESDKWDLIILDEVNVAVGLKLLKAGDVVSVLKTVPPEKIVILTGRRAPASFLKLADLATEMKELKHPYRKGKPAQEGVEF